MQIYRIAQLRVSYPGSRYKDHCQFICRLFHLWFFTAFCTSTIEDYFTRLAEIPLEIQARIDSHTFTLLILDRIGESLLFQVELGQKGTKAMTDQLND